jgi:hypothetical protein
MSETRSSAEVRTWHPKPKRMGPIHVVLALAMVGLAKGDGPPLTLESFEWAPSSTSEAVQIISCGFVNNLNLPMTQTSLTIDFYAADGTKLGETFVFIDTLPAGQRVLY